MPVTSHDVAKLAGVSQPTVSRALRDQRGVSPATRHRVRQAADALGYVPQQSGRSLSTRRSRRIGIVTDELTNPFYPALIAPLHRHLAAAGYRTILLTDTRASFDLEPVLDGSLDGVVLTTCRAGSDLPAELGRRGIPLVLVNREIAGAPGDACVPDNAAGAELVADLLVRLGHTAVGVLGGPDDTSTSKERCEAFARRLATHGVRLPSAAVVRGEYSVRAGEEAFATLWDRTRPTALFCANDVLAVGALNAARRRGVGVPEEVTVVGFDDIALAGYALVDLTTVRIDHEELAARAVAQLLERLDAPDLPGRRSTVRPALVLRGTHAARRSDSPSTPPSTGP